VRVYLNLHKPNHFSIVDHKTGLVIGYSEHVTLSNCTFYIRESGRQRVIKNKRKEVHAYIIGNFITAEYNLPNDQITEIYYNPYITETFIIKVSQQPIYQADLVYCHNRKVFIISG
jgi:hypothetical protein